VLGERGYDAAAIRRGLRARHILPLLAMRRIRYDKRADIHEAFLSLSCAWVCRQSLCKGWNTAEP
jgi:hypothetical protein